LININPKIKNHPLINSGPMSSLYKEVVKCTKCERLVDFREQIAFDKRKQFKDWIYWGKPIAGFGDIKAKLLIVGLAPAAHGGNRTGRVFTGDKSADFLMDCLHSEGIANQSSSNSLNDGLKLKNAFMTTVLKCVPPGDKPTALELKNCSNFFQREMKQLKNISVILALGKIGFDGCLKYFRNDFDLKLKDYPFGHDLKYMLPNGKTLWGCYHPSPRNVNTKRLDKKMMSTLLRKVIKVLKK